MSTSRRTPPEDLPEELDLVELLDALPVMISAYDGEGRYLFANQRHALLHGGDRGTFLGRPVSELLGEEGYAGIRAEVERVLSGERVKYDVTLGNPADGSSSTFSTTYVPRLDEAGQPDGFYSISSNITARKRAEAENERLSEKMFGLQKLESLATLAGGVAHDFNNLLVSVLGNAELAEQRLAEHAALPGVHEALEELRHIREAASRAGELSRQMLAYSGGGRMQEAVVDASQLADEMVALIRSGIGSGVALSVEAEPGEHWLRVDPTQIRQVLLNLLTNASEAVGGKGTVSLRIRRERIDAARLAASVVDDGLPAGEFVVFEVEDDGPGVASGDEARIFEPFFSTKGTGRGLGLASCLGIVRGHRGAIDVSTASERGARFQVWLPGCEAELGTSSEELASRDRPANARLLVVDDEAEVRRTMLRILERAGYAVVPVENGREAVDATEKDPDGFDAVILDLTMPVMGGAEAFARIRAIAPSLPVILCSGFDEEQVRNDCQPRDFDAVVEKPFRVAELLAAVAQVVA